MKLYCADIRGGDPSRLRQQGRSPTADSAFAMSLLAYAVEDAWGMDLPKIVTEDTGKPVFLNRPELQFSVSHGGGFVLAALSHSPVGVDLEPRREIGEKYRRRILKDQEMHGYDFFQIWCLRESLLKLRGAGDLRKPLTLCAEERRILCPEGDAWYGLLHGIEGCAAAVCGEREFEVPQINWVEIGKLYT